MSVADKITQLVNDISSSYQKIQSKGGTIPTNKNTNNLPNAIDSIPSGGGEAVIEPLQITENGTYTASEGVDGYSPIAVNVTSGLAYDMGEFVLDAEVKAIAGIPHDLGSIPEFILVWTDDLVGTTNAYGNVTNVGFVWMKNLTGLKQRLTTSLNTTGLTINYNQHPDANILSTSAPNSVSYCHEGANDTNTTFVLHQIGSTNYWRAGITYKYFVAKAWWNTELGGATNA